MKKITIILATIAFYILFCAGIALAQDYSTPPPHFELAAPRTFQYDPNVVPGAKIVALVQNRAAPFSGTLWNGPASAWLIAEYENAQKDLITEMNRRVDLTLNWATAEIAIQGTRCETDAAAMQERYDLSQRNLAVSQDSTQHLIRENRRLRLTKKVLIIGGTVVLVGAASGTIYLLAN